MKLGGEPKKMTRDEVRASVCYDWKENNDLLIGNDGEWYIGLRDGRNGWKLCRCISNLLHCFREDRVRCMKEHGQVDHHIKAMEARKDFQWCVDEIAREAMWELRSRNFGHAKRLKALADQCRPLVNDVWSKDWIEHREMMADCLSRMEP